MRSTASLVTSLVCLSLAVGCAAPPPMVTTPPDSTIDVPLPEGSVTRAIGKLDALVQEQMKRTGVPGVAVAVVHGGKVVYAKGFGVREVGSTAPVDADTVFQLASLSKSVGATVVAGVVGKGTVAWSDPVQKHFPEFKLKDEWVSREVTIADLYSHRSGLPDHAGDWLEDLGFDQAQVFERLRHYELAPFRSTYAYTNFGLTAAAEAVAKASGKPWAALSREVLYAPLGMSSTSSSYADYLAASNRATPHRRVDGTWQKSARDPSAQTAAGGVSSSANDLAKWMLLQLGAGKYEGTQVIDEEALLQMRLPHSVVSERVSSPAARAGFYGLGMNVGYDSTGRVRLGHSGAFFLGVGTTYSMLPSDGVGIVVLTNGMPVGVAEIVSASFMDLVQHDALTRDWVTPISGQFERMLLNDSSLAGKTPPASPAAARAAASYVGTYPNALHGPANILEVDGGLVLELGPRGMRFPLQHWDGDTFAFSPPGENGVGLTALTFTVGQDGKATSFRAEFYDKEGLGTFTR